MSHPHLVFRSIDIAPGRLTDLPINGHIRRSVVSIYRRSVIGKTELQQPGRIVGRYVFLFFFIRLLLGGLLLWRLRPEVNHIDWD